MGAPDDLDNAAEELRKLEYFQIVQTTMEDKKRIIISLSRR